MTHLFCRVYGSGAVLCIDYKKVVTYFLRFLFCVMIAWFYDNVRKYNKICNMMIFNIE